MKEKIIIFLIGLLVGAIISTGSIYAYTVANSDSKFNEMDMQMPNGRGQGGMMEENKNTPPEIPDDGQKNNQNIN